MLFLKLQLRLIIKLLDLLHLNPARRLNRLADDLILILSLPFQILFVPLHRRFHIPIGLAQIVHCYFV